MTDNSLANLLISGVAGLTRELINTLPVAWRHRPRTNNGYDFDDDQLVTASKAAMLLSQPLILAGEPGVGKTSFARALAHKLELPFLPPIHVKSTTSGMDLFYSFNEVARFRDASNPNSTAGLLDYVVLSSLGRAIVLSAGPDAVVRLTEKSPDALFGGAYHGLESSQDVTLGQLFAYVFRDAGDVSHPQRSIVLVDELDKAPRDAPNDVLAEFEDMRFTISELGITLQAAPETFPVVLITSNSERSFPDAFLRRSVFHWIETPTDARLCRIIASASAADGTLSPSDPLVTSAVDYFMLIRKTIENKKPSTAELISFVSALVAAGLKPTETVSDAHPKVRAFKGILMKTRIDLEAE